MIDIEEIDSLSLILSEREYTKIELYFSHVVSGVNELNRLLEPILSNFEITYWFTGLENEEDLNYNISCLHVLHVMKKFENKLVVGKVVPESDWNRIEWIVDLDSVTSSNLRRGEDFSIFPNLQHIDADNLLVSARDLPPGITSLVCDDILSVEELYDRGLRTIVITKYINETHSDCSDESDSDNDCDDEDPFEEYRDPFGRYPGLRLYINGELFLGKEMGTLQEFAK